MCYIISDYRIGTRKERFRKTSKWMENEMWTDRKESSWTETSGRKETHRRNPVLETNNTTTEGTRKLRSGIGNVSKW